jgi:hypothetical protein
MRNKRTKMATKSVTALFLLILTLSAAGCTNHYLTKQMLLEQVIPEKELQKGSVTMYAPAGNIMIPLGVSYRANNLARILCYNDQGKRVFVSVNLNTQLIITDKKGEAHKFYLDTVYLSDNKMSGLRSRLMGLERSIPLEEIDKIEVYTEQSKETAAE